MIELIKKDLEDEIYDAASFLFTRACDGTIGENVAIQAYATAAIMVAQMEGADKAKWLNAVSKQWDVLESDV